MPPSSYQIRFSAYEPNEATKRESRNGYLAHAKASLGWGFEARVRQEHHGLGLLKSQELPGLQGGSADCYISAMIMKPGHQPEPSTYPVSLLASDHAHGQGLGKILFQLKGSALCSAVLRSYESGAIGRIGYESGAIGREANGAKLAILRTEHPYYQ